MLRDLFSLFPAYAGVIPDSLPGAAFKDTFPRIRGGDPVCDGKPNNDSDFSPHTRG